MIVNAISIQSQAGCVRWSAVTNVSQGQQLAQAGDAGLEPFKPLLEYSAFGHFRKQSPHFLLVAAQVGDVINHQTLLQITVQIHRHDLASATQPKAQGKIQLMARAYFKKHRGFRGMLERAKTLNTLNPHAEPAEVRWGAQ